MLLKYQTGPQSLGDTMRESLTQDALDSTNPVLLEPHLKALDRRVRLILQVSYHFVAPY